MTLLASIEDFAAARGATADPADVKAHIALEGASSLVRGYVGRTFDAYTDTELYLDGTGTDALILPEPPVTAVEIVTLDAENAETEVAETDYRLDPDAGIVYLLGDRWPLGRRNVKVTATGGYELPHDGTPGTLPPALQMVVIQVAARLYGTAGTGGGVVTSRSIGQFSETFGATTRVRDSGLTALEESALAAYRLPRA